MERVSRIRVYGSFSMIKGFKHSMKNVIIFKAKCDLPDC